MIVMIFMTTTTKRTQSIRRSCSCRYIHLVQHFANSVSQIFLPYLLHAISMHYRKATCHTKHQCTLKCYRIKQIWPDDKHFSIRSYLISIYEQDSWSCGKLSNWDVFSCCHFLEGTRSTSPTLTKFHTAYLWAFSFLSYGAWCMWTIQVDEEKTKCGLIHKTLTGCKASPVCSLHVWRSPHNRALPSSRFGSQAPHTPE